MLLVDNKLFEDISLLQLLQLDYSKLFNSSDNFDSV
jgi:hypothetical protein